MTTLFAPRARANCATRIADRPGTRNDDVAPFQRPRAAGGVRCHGRRFDHRAVVGRHTFGQRDDALFGDDEVVLRHAVGLEGLDAQVRADVILPALAGVALAADELRTPRHAVARLHLAHRTAHGHHLGRILVPLHHRIEGGGMLSVIRVYLRTADTDAQNAQQHLVGFQVSRLGGGDLPEFDLFRGGQNDLSHGCKVTNYFSFFFLPRQQTAKLTTPPIGHHHGHAMFTRRPTSHSLNGPST